MKTRLQNELKRTTIEVPIKHAECKIYRKKMSQNSCDNNIRPSLVKTHSLMNPTVFVRH